MSTQDRKPLHVIFDMVSGMAFISMGERLASLPGTYRTQRDANAVANEVAATLGWLDEPEQEQPTDFAP